MFDHMACDHDVERRVVDRVESINVEINIEMGIWAVRLSDQFGPRFVASTRHRTVGERDVGAIGGREWLEPRSDLKYLTVQRSPDCVAPGGHDLEL